MAENYQQHEFFYHATAELAEQVGQAFFVSRKKSFDLANKIQEFAKIAIERSI
jgi:hypothetical protein